MFSLNSSDNFLMFSIIGEHVPDLQREGVEKLITIGFSPITSWKSNLYKSGLGFLSEVIKAKDDLSEIILVCILGGMLPTSGVCDFSFTSIIASPLKS